MPEPPTTDRSPLTNSLATDATQPMPAPTFEIPPELADHPRYRIVSELGRGGMGVVYKAEHRLMGRAVAIKVVQPERIGDATARDRFRSEIRTAARLEHENIVRAYEAETAGQLTVLAMELIDGTCLASFVEGGRRLPPATACDYVRQAAHGLQYMHEHGLMHRDIKPQNLMVTRRGTVKILDVGLARSGDMVETRVTQSGECIGTPDYIAPEQATDTRSADIRADIYSLGCTLYHLLSGQKPFRGASVLNVVTARLTTNALPLDAVVTGLPPGLSDIVDKMMAREPGDRYQTPAEVADALTQYCTIDLSRTIRPATVVAPARTPSVQALLAAPASSSGRRSILWGAAIRVGAVVLLVLLASGILWPSGDTPPSPPPPLGPELLKNPGGEEPLVGTKVPGWIEVQGTWSVRRNDPTAVEGTVYFAPDAVAVAELRQDLSVQDNAAEIDTGRLPLAFKGFVRSSRKRLGHADTSRIVVEYRDAPNATVLTSFDSGDIASTGSWKIVEDRRQAPAGTRWIRVRLISTRHGLGTNNDGYYDGLSLKRVLE
ncbi:MAG: serine/threonine-protein kinase [Gemmataceae bacterium]